MLSDYRIVKIGEKYTVKLVKYDSDQNPVTTEPVVLETDDIDDMSSVLIYLLSSLTKPVLDAEVFDPLTIEDSDVKTALDLMRNNNDT